MGSFLNKLVFIISIFFVCTSLGLQPKITYYPDSFYKDYESGLTRDKDLKTDLQMVLSSLHQQNEGQQDQIVSSCKGSCYSHKEIGYGRARQVIFGELYLQKKDQQYFVHDEYCEYDISSGVGPGLLPSDKVINVEHTWPQSRFSSRFPKDLQKSDLHHLFPTDSQMNSARGNFPFADVLETTQDLKCNTVKLGYTDSLKRSHYFEPPEDHKGRVARALFYFSVRYNLTIGETEEKYLRQWHKNHPPDDSDRMVNDFIFKKQMNRNPFVDYPELVDAIADF